MIAYDDDVTRARGRRTPTRDAAVAETGNASESQMRAVALASWGYFGRGCGVALGWLVLVALIGVGPALGLELPALGETEQLALGVSAADAVVIARVERLIDSVTTKPNREFTVARYAVLVQMESMKGDSVPLSAIVGIPQFGPPPYALKERFVQSGSPGVFFLRRRGPAWGLVSEWAPNQGAMPISESEVAGKAAEIRALAQKQSLVRVMQQADLIIVGTPLRKTFCTGTTTEICLTFRVDSVVVGSESRSEIEAFSPRLPILPPGKCVFVLERSSVHGYTIVGHHAGAIPLAGARGRSLPALLREIQNARKAKGD